MPETIVMPADTVALGFLLGGLLCLVEVIDHHTDGPICGNLF
jgi:hypothetical protein